MPLHAGQRVGPYEVVGPLGAGGMGEVYRARDARLKRDVALKVLPARLITDADSRARFDREAQVLASLNHPSVAQIFGVEVDGGAPVIVMELVDGETLAGILARGRLPIGDALTIARQICDGLEAAHDRGIIHRDLKPANIKVRADGTIKILDFGLARVLTADAGADTADSPTVLGRTNSGIILGTAAYMSPEQARGRNLDKRTDIWSFGCVLYEMLTGAAPFKGDSATDILSDIVRVDPAWDQLPRETPARIVELVRHCLQKNTKDRLRDIGDARFEIERALQSPDGADASDGVRAQTPSARSPWTAALWFAAGAAVAAAAVIGTSALRAKTEGPAPIARTSVTLPPETSLTLSRGSAVALSPDGRHLAFVASTSGVSRVYLRPLDRFESQPLMGTEGAASPFFSADGRWIGFFAASKLKKVPLDGSAPVTVADVNAPRGEAWSADDFIYLTPSNNVGISRLPAAGGPMTPVTTPGAGELSHRWPSLLPGGSILFAIWNDQGWDPSRLAVKSADGAAPKVVIEGGGYGRYIRDEGTRGFVVYARAEGLLAVRFDESRLAVEGQPVSVVDGVITNLSGGAHFTLSASGTLAYVPGAIREADRELVWVALDGKVTPARRIHGMSQRWALARDGVRVLRTHSVGQGGENWIENLATGTTTQLPNPSGGFNRNPVWSGDAAWVAFSKGRPFANIYRAPANGQGREERLTTTERTHLATSVSPDGRSLLYTEFDPVTGTDIWVLALPPGPPGTSSEKPQARPFVKTGGLEGSAMFSPDGRWIAYQSNESGRYEIVVRSFPDGQQSFQVSSGGGFTPMWSRTGTEIFYRGVDNKMRVTPANPQGGAGAVAPRVLFDAAGYEDGYAVAPDNKRLLMMPRFEAEKAATEVRVVLNFLSELRQRVR